MRSVRQQHSRGKRKKTPKKHQVDAEIINSSNYRPRVNNFKQSDQPSRLVIFNSSQQKQKIEIHFFRSTKKRFFFVAIFVERLLQQKKNKQNPQSVFLLKKIIENGINEVHERADICSSAMAERIFVSLQHWEKSRGRHKKVYVSEVQWVWSV